MKKVAAFVYNNCKSDARVLKEAGSLAKAGYDVTIYAVQDKTVPNEEERDGFRIVRVPKKPIHFVFFQKVKGAINQVAYWIKRVFFRILAQVVCIVGFSFPKSEVTAWGTLAIYLNDYKSSFGLVKNHFTTAILKSANVLPLLLLALIYGPIALFLLVVLSPVLLVGVLGLALFMLLRKVLMAFHRPLCFRDFKFRVLEVLKNERIDIFHAHDYHTLPTALACKKAFGGKVVYDSHELYTEISTWTALEKWMNTRGETRDIGKADGVITVNHSIAEELVERYGIRYPTVVMNCPPASKEPLNMSGNLFLEAAGVAGDVRVLLYQGGFSYNRGLFELIEAMQHVSEGVLVMMGWGKIEAELKDHAKRLGLANRVYFIPPVAQDLILQYSACADIGVIPYQAVGLNNYYTSPNKLFEYLNAHIPIAGSFFPELKKVILEKQVGKVFDPEKPISMAEVLNEMLSDNEELAAMKSRTVEVAKMYTWENEEQKIVQLYTKL